jgi:hypothetical protein
MKWADKLGHAYVNPVSGIPKGLSVWIYGLKMRCINHYQVLVLVLPASLFTLY